MIRGVDSGRYEGSGSGFGLDGTQNLDCCAYEINK